MSDPKIIFRSARMLFREFNHDDAAELFDLNNDPEVIRFTGDEPYASLDSAKKFISNYNHYSRDGYGRWTVIEEPSSGFLGYCGLHLNKETGETDIGFRFRRNTWGKGFATEAAARCVEYAFNELNISRVIGRAMKENRASIRVLEKIGMKFQKEFEAHGGVCVQLHIIK